MLVVAFLYLFVLSFNIPQRIVATVIAAEKNDHFRLYLLYNGVGNGLYFFLLVWRQVGKGCLQNGMFSEMKINGIERVAGYGIRNVGSKEPVTDSSVFHTASVSKLFTAMAVMKLIKENKLSLETSIAEVIPEIHFDDERVKFITIKQLLNHTSGLPDVSDYHWDRQNKSETALENYIAEEKNTRLIICSPARIAIETGLEIF